LKVKWQAGRSIENETFAQTPDFEKQLKTCPKRLFVPEYLNNTKKQHH